MRKVRVGLGEKSYDIIISTDSQELDNELEQFAANKGYSRKVLLIDDSNTAPLYGERIQNILKKVGLDPVEYTIPAGESSKAFKQAEDIYTVAIEHGLDRKSAVFALGGGVVGDLAGFIAATYMRGIGFVQIPTSLLAQVDSSVGGKVAVNHPLGKNLIGAFYQPQAVFMDVNMLSTLPKREISTGLGEIVKYGIIYDKEFFEFLESHKNEAMNLEQETAVHMIARSCEIKAAVVSKDEKESGLRAILNFGHTLAHSIEKNTGYTVYNHGEAVGIGMVGAAYISRELGRISMDEYNKAVKLIGEMGLPLKVEGCNADALYQAIFHDKKTINGHVNWVLMDEIGKVSVTSQVPENVVKEAINSIS